MVGSIKQNKLSLIVHILDFMTVDGFYHVTCIIFCVRQLSMNGSVLCLHVSTFTDCVCVLFKHIDLMFPVEHDCHC